MREAVRYFKERPALFELAMTFCEKYRHLGHWGGAVILGDLETGALQEISSCLRRQVQQGSRVTYQEFFAAWGKTRFAADSLPDVLKEAYPGKLDTKRTEENRSHQERQHTLLELMRGAESDRARSWLEALFYGKLRLSHPESYRNPMLLQAISLALSRLPDSYERLPFFANRIFGNPHALDMEKEANHIFLQALSYLSSFPLPQTVEEKNELLYRHHLLRDDILNFATVYGLTAFAGGREIAYWRMAAETEAPLNIPFREIVRAEKIEPLQIVDQAPRVAIVENSGVFSELLDALQRHACKTALVALHGQLKTASWALLDRLVLGGSELHYAGDLDPEGLRIAEKLLSRYPSAHVWRFPVSGEQGNALSTVRKKKLDQIRHPELQPYVAQLRRLGYACYQESITEELLQDLLDGTAK